ncbi:carbohydrate sulfotransferase 11-like [Penaeus chinensis]|uniref:carbohydrate sulfotransferase 11-like n=1 Tax=Penaeus chinensis TaxID=139456 RepID=UPI001FB76181|nr:carbohydrate sulfotransferase 11-like [Penaeus chinensis]
MLATSFCRKEVRILVYIILGFSLFSVLHVSLLKFENLQSVKGLERAEGADQGGGSAEGGRGKARTVISEAKEFSSTSRGRRKKVQAKGRVKDKVGEGRRRKWEEVDKCKTMYGNLNGHFFKDEVVALNWTEGRSQARRELFQQRAKVLLDACAKLDDTQGALKPPLSVIYQNNLWLKDHDLIYCPINKVGSTTWITSLLQMAGQETNHGRGRVRKIYSAPLSIRDRNSFLKKAMRMIIVRNPLDRLLSGYRDKMLHLICKENQFSVMQKLISTKYSDPDTPPDPSGRPSFRQFLLFIREEMEMFWQSQGQHEVNNHWKPFWWYCAPCHFEYNAVAHMESLSEDQEYILRETKLSGKINNTRTHSSKNDNFTSTHEAAKWYFGQIPRSLLEEVIRLYQPDFDIFGYSPDYHLAFTTEEQ